MDRNEIEAAACCSSFFMILSLVSGVVLVILGSFDLAAALDVKKAPEDNIVTICQYFPTKSITQNMGMFQVTCPYTITPLIMCFLSIFLQYMPFIIIKAQKFFCSNFLWVLIRLISLTSLLLVTLELFAKENAITEFCISRNCSFKKNTFDISFFGILIFFEFCTTLLWVSYYIKVRGEFAIRQRNGDPIKEVKLVIVPSQQISASDEKICSVCLDAINSKKDNAILPCSHKFHYTCIHDWLKKTLTCPVCRAKPGEIKLPRSTLEPIENGSREVRP
jgi:hypothetical protein